MKYNVECRSKFEYLEQTEATLKRCMVGTFRFVGRRFWVQSRDAYGYAYKVNTEIWSREVDLTTE